VKFSHLPLTTKLTAINLLLVAALLSVVAVAWRHLPADGAASEVAQLGRAQRATQNADMLHDALHADVLQALLVGQLPGDARDEARKSVQANAQEFRAELAALDSMDLGLELKPQIDGTREVALAYVQEAEHLVHLALEDRRAALLAMPQFEEAFDRAKHALAAQTSLVARTLDEAHEQARADTDAARRWLLIAALATVLAGGVGVALIARSIRRSLMALRDVAQGVAAGDLGRRSLRPGHDEVGQLAAAIDKMAGNLQDMIERMRTDAERGTFGAALVRALDMADSEPQAHEVATRAMALVSPTHAMELLLADSSEAHLERAAEHPSAGAPGCSVDSPFSCLAVRRGHAVAFPDSEALDACPKLRGRASGPVAAACVPVTFMGRALGVVHACAPREQALPADAIDRLTALGTQLGSRVGTVRAFERTQLQASTDALTGLPNRRSVEARMRELMRTRTPFAFVMADLDRFKQLNDTHGHQAGDEALRAFADVVREGVRQHDVAGRWGGEEFAFVLEKADAAQAEQWVARLRERLAQALQRRSAPLFTASFGIADATLAQTAEELVAAADAALYRAKADGRDRGVVAVLPLVGAAVARQSEQRAALDPQRLAVNV